MKINAEPLDLEFFETSLGLKFEGKTLQPGVRTLEQMMDVLCDQAFAARANPKLELYYMYREVQRAQDRALFQKTSTRYDITIMPPLNLGDEYSKTAGHYHPLANQATRKSFPEIYQVLYGEAHYLLQKRAIKNGAEADEEIAEAILVHAKAGDAVLVPPNFGHVTINPSQTIPLIMCNLVEASFKSDYEPFKKMHGAAFLEHAGGSLVPNDYYAKKPEIKKTAASEFAPTKLAGISTKSIYQQFLDAPEKFEYLRNP